MLDQDMITLAELTICHVVAEMDINPLIASGDRIVAVDALIRPRAPVG